MNKIFDYLKLAVFVVGILVGVQVPGFVDQYGKNLEARVIESEMSISGFQDDADKYFAGDITQLIQHYSKKVDPVIVAGGENIEVLVLRNQALKKAQEVFNQSMYSAYIHVFIGPVEEIRHHAWSSYTYGVVLNGSAISIGIAVGLLSLAFFELMIFALKLAFQRFSVSRKPAEY